MICPVWSILYDLAEWIRILIVPTNIYQWELYPFSWFESRSLREISNSNRCSFPKNLVFVFIVLLALEFTRCTLLWNSSYKKFCTKTDIKLLIVAVELFHIYVFTCMHIYDFFQLSSYLNLYHLYYLYHNGMFYLQFYMTYFYKKVIKWLEKVF